ncbi:MAG: hypothetical protein OXH52_10875, partial [Gammaproteobacteria bacterium]|nr:hypothetical protein [Gammaproteobacteria bacterium]
PTESGAYKPSGSQEIRSIDIGVPLATRAQESALLFGQGLTDTSVAVGVATVAIVVDAMKMAEATQRTNFVNVRTRALRE